MDARRGPGGIVGARILVVDDDPLQVAALAALLRMEGATAVIATSGEVAYARVRETPLDAVLLDVIMPLEDGPALFARLRAVRPELPVVWVTGCEAQHPRVESSLTTAAVSYVMKPVDMRELVDAIERMLPPRP